MQFLVLGYDGSDEGAADRRQAVRESHLNQAKEMVENGKWLYGAAILDDNEKMIGSMIVCDFPSKEDLDKQWLDTEPYITGKVWEKVEISRAMVPPFILGK